MNENPMVLLQEAYLQCSGESWGLGNPGCESKVCHLKTACDFGLGAVSSGISLCETAIAGAYSLKLG